MLLNLIGLYQDGSNPAPGVPTNPRVPITTQIGGSATIVVKLLRPSGAGVSVTSGWSFLLTCKRRPQDQPPAFQLTGAVQPLLGSNVMAFTLTPTATKLLQPGRYSYDVLMVDPSGNRDFVIPLSPFILQPAAVLAP